MANKLGDILSSSIILKTHVLTGSDVTSKIGTKSSAIKNNPERFPVDLGYFRLMSFNNVQPVGSLTNEGMKCFIHKKGLSELPPATHFTDTF